MASKELLEIVRCLTTGSRLTVLHDTICQQLNQAIASGELENSLGQTLHRQLDSGLVNEDRSLVYPIYDGIPQLMRDEAIPLAQLD